MESSQICRFYKGQTVFITGGTGFLGKILVEKLLRSTKVAKIYVIIREKKRKNTVDRLNDLFGDQIFSRLTKERPDFRNCVSGVNGDCSLENLGLTDDAKEMLISEVNVVIHAAATVNFKENLKSGFEVNVKGTEQVLNLCKELKNLKSVIYVSSAFSNCQREPLMIDEIIYDHPLHYKQIEKLLHDLSKEEADLIAPTLMQKWPNSYTFTKAVSESMIKELADELPIGIFRPAIIISTYKEPIEGWINNLYGATGVCAAAIAGVLRVLNSDPDAVADMVPVDTCTAGIIAAAWDVANKRRNNIINSDNIPVYNYVSSCENPISWREYHHHNSTENQNFPSIKSIWPLFYMGIKNRKLYLLLRFLLHIIPGLFVDLCLFLTAQKPKMLKTYKTIHTFSEAIAPFATKNFKFENNNVVKLWDKMNDADKKLFPFSIKLVDWSAYFPNYLKGVRVYLLEDPMDTVQDAKKRLRKLKVMHNLLVYSLFVVVFYSMFRLSGKLYNMLDYNYIVSLIY